MKLRHLIPATLLMAAYHLANAADNVIVIQGQDVCPADNVVVEGSNHQISCGCPLGKEQVGTGQPNYEGAPNAAICEENQSNADPQPPGSDPGGGGIGGGGGGSAPNKPTKDQCKNDKAQCESVLATEAYTGCEARLEDAVKESFNNFNWTAKGDKKQELPSCFGEQDYIIAGIVGQMSSFCFGEESYREENAFSDSCRSRYKAIALSHCLEGYTENSGANVSINLGPIGIGGNTTLSSATGEGIKQFCASVRLARIKQCDADYMQCYAKAEGTTPRILIDPVASFEAETQALISRIDRARLGFNNVQPTVPGRGSFRSLAQASNEDRVLYQTRMKFLAEWSEFLREEAIGLGSQHLAQLAFLEAQTSFKNTEKHFVAVYVADVYPDPRKGAEGKRLAHLEYLRWTYKRGYENRLNVAESSLRVSLGRAFGERRKVERFMTEVWPGISNFGYLAPMTPRQDVLAPPTR